MSVTPFNAQMTVLLPPRRDLDQHLEECSKQLIRYNFSILCCDAVLPRKAMEHHVATSTEHSTEFLLQHMMKLTVLFNQMCAKSDKVISFRQTMWLAVKALQKESVAPCTIPFAWFHAMIIPQHTSPNVQI